MLDIHPRLKGLVERQLAERAAPRPDRAERPVTTVRSRALHDLQFRATVEGHEFLSDEREESGGSDAGPAPLRYFLGGVMMCHQVWCVKTAALRDVPIDRLECEISGYVERGAQGSDDGRGFSRATYRVDLDSSAPPEAIQEVVDRAAKGCASFVTFARSAPIDLTLVLNGAIVYEHRYGGVPAHV